MQILISFSIVSVIIIYFILLFVIFRNKKKIINIFNFIVECEIYKKLCGMKNNGKH